MIPALQELLMREQKQSQNLCVLKCSVPGNNLLDEHPI
jgi:hypothetical protein